MAAVRIPPWLPTRPPSNPVTAASPPASTDATARRTGVSMYLWRGHRVGREHHELSSHHRQMPGHAAHEWVDAGASRDVRRVGGALARERHGEIREHK